MHARDLMTSPPITCHVNDPLTIAAQRMWDGDFGVLPVCNDDGTLTGVITDRDICMAAFTQGRSLDALLVNSAMGSHKVIAASPDTTIGELERLMADHQIRRIPIIDSDGTPIGIVSLNDLALASDRKRAPSTIAHTLAAISAHRDETRTAA